MLNAARYVKIQYELKMSVNKFGVDFNLINKNRRFMSKTDIAAVPILSLAYLGDSVFEVLVRTYLVSSGKYGPSVIHKASLSYVPAPRQAQFAKELMQHLTEEEAWVYRRGRNAKVGSVPHNSTVEEYHSATGLECLFGYLYLKGEGDRIDELFSMILGEENAI